MNRTIATWCLGVLGWVVSYAFFTKWLVEHEWDFFGGWVVAFSANDFATGLLSDLVVVTLMMIALAIWDRKRLGPKWTIAVIASLGLSVSISLAIYLVGIARHSADTQGGAAPEQAPAPTP